MKDKPFVNFDDDPKTHKTRAYCIKCFEPYTDWNPAENIAYCPKCRKKEAAPSAAS